MQIRGLRGRDRMFVGFTTICTISAYHHYSCEFKPRSWRGVLDTKLCEKVCQWIATGRWFSPGTPVSSINKTYSYYITKILLKVALITINQTESKYANVGGIFPSDQAGFRKILKNSKDLLEYMQKHSQFEFSTLYATILHSKDKLKVLVKLCFMKRIHSLILSKKKKEKKGKKNNSQFTK